MKKRIILLLILLLVIATYAWHSTGKIRFASTLKEFNNDAQSVVLERYYSGNILQTSRISIEDFKPFLDQLPSQLGLLTHTFSRCWVPHHSIKFDGSTDVYVKICFTCDELWTQKTGRRYIPDEWRQPFRAMFLENEISDTAPTSEELSQYYDAMITDAEQAASSNH